MPKSFPPTMRRRVCARLRAGEPVAEIAAETRISPATLFRWKAQVPVDAGVREGTPSVEADELAAANKRIAALQTTGAGQADIGSAQSASAVAALDTRGLCLVFGEGHSRVATAAGVGR